MQKEVRRTATERHRELIKKAAVPRRAKRKSIKNPLFANNNFQKTKNPAILRSQDFSFFVSTHLNLIDEYGTAISVTGRFGQEAPLSRREAYEGTSSLENGGRKSPYKPKNFAEIQPLFLTRFSRKTTLVDVGCFIRKRTFSVLTNMALRIKEPC